LSPVRFFILAKYCHDDNIKILKIDIKGISNFKLLNEANSTTKPFIALPSGQIGDVDEGVVEGSVDVGNPEDLLALANLRAEGDLDLLDLLLLSFTWSHLDEVDWS
jgi:hypothetical protein